MCNRSYSLVAAVFSLGVLLSPVATSATTYYVTKSGNDSHGCTNNTTDACLTIQRGINVAHAAGNTLQVGDGTYAESPTVSSGGSSGSQFIIQGYTVGGSCPTTPQNDVYSPTRTRPDPGVTVNGIWTISGNYVRVQCFKLASGKNVTISGTGDDYWDNYHTSNVNQKGVNVEGGVNCTVKRNYIYQANYGIYLYNSHGCTIQENELDGLKETYTSGADMDYIRILGTSYDTTFMHNFMHGADQADCAAGSGCHIDCLQTWSVSGGVNTIHDITWDRNVCLNSWDGIIWRDTIHGSYTLYNITVTNSIFAYKDGFTGFNVWCGVFEHVQNVTFEQNTCNYKGIHFDFGTTGSIQNNTVDNVPSMGDGSFDTCGGGVYKPIGLTNSSSAAEGHNILYSTCGVILQSNFPNDIVNSHGGFVAPGTDCGTSACWGDLHLAATSSSIGAGAAGLGTGVDLDGVTRGSPPDIGSYEYRALTTSLPDPPTNVQAVIF